MSRLIALLTCHNRRDKTLAALDAYFACQLPEGVERLAVLVDDGSDDGTTEAVLARFPAVMVERGDGSLFWNRGMLRAWQSAQNLQPDHVLWLNDDTSLYADALLKLFEAAEWTQRKYGRPGIVVGSTENSQGQLSYGGSVPASLFNRLNLRKVQPLSQPQAAITMNGNCVLVPHAVSARIGLIDGVFRHAMGDLDYGFRASRAGIPVTVMAGMAGHCDNDHTAQGSHADTSLPLRVRWRKMTASKGLPPQAWRALCQRHAGVLWPAVWVLPYARLLLSSVRRK